MTVVQAINTIGAQSTTIDNLRNGIGRRENALKEAKQRISRLEALAESRKQALIEADAINEKQIACIANLEKDLEAQRINHGRAIVAYDKEYRKNKELQALMEQKENRIADLERRLEITQKWGNDLNAESAAKESELKNRIAGLEEKLAAITAIISGK